MCSADLPSSKVLVPDCLITDSRFALKQPVPYHLANPQYMFAILGESMKNELHQFHW